MPARCNAPQLVLLRRIREWRRPMHSRRAPAPQYVYMHEGWRASQRTEICRNRHTSVQHGFTGSVLMVDLLEVW